MKSLLLIFIVLFSANVNAGWDEAAAAYKIGDYTTAFDEFIALAEQGDVRAQTLLGRMYDQGHSTTQDYKAAVHWYRKAAEQGNDTAQFNLGLMYAKGQGVTQDHKAASHWFRKAAEQGNENAQHALGLMYIAIQDYVRAHMWLNIAASNGHSNALEARDAVQERMTTSDISKAQDFARECVANEYKNC